MRIQRKGVVVSQRKMKSYNELKVNILEQTSNKSVVFTFGRFQPPTSGHQLLINKVIKEAKKRGAEHRIYPSHSHDKKSNPLSHKDKVLYMRKLFPKANVMDDKKAKTPFHVLESLSKEGYTEVYFMVGGDRVSEFKNGMKKYVGKDGYNFDTFEVISAGHRDPDAEGVVGMSGSKMRKAASADEFEQFLNGVPDKTSKRVSLGLFKAIRKGMGLKEEYISVNSQQRFNVRLANTDETRARGLMHEKSMSDDDGMLFVFEDEDYHGIWMKNTFIPLDVVWINESGTIVDVATLQPHDLNTRRPAKPAKFVLEVNAGTFDGVIGDTLAERSLLRKLKIDKFSRSERKREKKRKKGVRKYNKMVGIPLASSYDSELNESVDNNFENMLTELSIQSRRKMARAAKRTAKRRAAKRKIKARRMKGADDLKKKAQKTAIAGFRNKMLKGRSWSTLSHSEKENLTIRMKKKYKPPKIARVAQKLLPGIRQGERERIAKLKGGGDKNEQVEYLTEPQALENLVKKLRAEGMGKSKAYAIATAQLQKSGVLKKGTYHELDERNYKLEYANYQGKPEQIARRSSRNKARRIMTGKGLCKMGDGNDVDHKDRNPLNNDIKNLRVQKKEKNRSFCRKVENGKPLEDGTSRTAKYHKKMTPGQWVEQVQAERVKEKHKKEKEKIQTRQDRELNIAKELDLTRKEKEKQRENDKFKRERNRQRA